MIDGHCHLEGGAASAMDAMQSLYEAGLESQVQKVVLLNLPELAYPNADVLEHSDSFDGFFVVFPAVNPLLDTPLLLEELKERGAKGIKLHPRMHGYNVTDVSCVEIVRICGDLGLPVVADCFPDGKNLALGNQPSAFARLAELAPKTRISMAHGGGHHILDAVMATKYYPNLFMDLSFTLLYYRGTRVMDDLAYAVRCARGEKIMWGSDYPDRPYGETVALSRGEMAAAIAPEFMENVVSKNTCAFLGDEFDEQL